MESIDMVVDVYVDVDVWWLMYDGDVSIHLVDVLISMMEKFWWKSVI